uniref:Fibronectin type-III domain-containing protein n=1 Tax=Callorhinchus milii TaxID=7868 RepID=A0A4W3JSF0_CALMI
ATANRFNIQGVSSVRVLEARSDVLRVSWVGVRGATNYRVSWRRSDGGAETSRVVPGDIYTIDIPGLEGGVSYTVKVVALIENREGAPVTITATTPSIDRPVEIVSNLRVIGSSKRQIRIAWTGVSRSSGYRIYWRLADGM